MSVRIRMKMTGRKHQPFFRICVIDRQKSRDGLPIEELGTYDPMVGPPGHPGEAVNLGAATRVQGDDHAARGPIDRRTR